MPDSRRIRWSQFKVGMVALTALAIVAVLIFLLTGRKGLFERDIILRTYMDDASGMQKDTPVRLNGITVGYLYALQLTGSRDPRRAVEFIMKIQEQYLSKIPVDSVAGVSASNLLGDKFVNITKGRSAQHVKDGDEIPSLQAQDIPQLMGQMASVLQSLQTIVKRVDDLLAGVEQGKGNIGKLLKDEELYNRLNGIASEGQRLLADVRGGRGTLSKLLYDDALYQEIRAPVKRIDAMLADLQAGQGSAGKLLKDPALYDEARKLIAEIRSVTGEINSGKGTAGKLLKDEQLYNRLDLLVVKFNIIVDKMNTGQGTLGQLIVNPQLYDALNGMTREFQGLARDMRANPKKFLTIRLALF